MRKFSLKSLLALLLATVTFLSSGISADAAMLGIDVSKHNGGINWGAVASSGVSYAFIKVGSTNSGMDPYFPANVQGAQAAGVRTGVYIYSYATDVAGAVNEANQVLAWIEPYNINFPVAYDIENSTQQNLDKATVTAMCNAFCDVIYSAGYTPLVYTYTSFFKSHVDPSQLRYDKWIAQYGSKCDIPGYTIWQYSSTGSVSGLSGNVDMNSMVVDYHSAIPQSAFVTASNGKTYFYNNYRKTRGWANVGGALYYLGDDFAMVRGWHADSTGTYYLSDQTGQALVGIQNIGGRSYYFGPNGAMQTGVLNIDNKLYYFNPQDGSMVTGWVAASNGAKYYFSQNGPALIGMNQVGNAWYCFGNDGLYLTGFQNVGGTWYFFDPTTGARAHGFQTINNKLYCFDGKTGAMKTGWFTVGSTDANKPVMYYADANGVVLTGLQTIGQATYLLTPAMARGFQSVNGGSMYFDEDSGILHKGWFSVRNANASQGDADRDKDYYADANGFILTGLQNIGGQYYYLESNGKIKGGVKLINGRKYFFDTSTAALQFGWIDLYDGDGGVREFSAGKGDVKYADAAETQFDDRYHTVFAMSDGSWVINSVITIGTDNYAFDSKGYLVRNGEIKINNVKYVTDKNGIATRVY